MQMICCMVSDVCVMFQVASPVIKKWQDACVHSTHAHTSTLTNTQKRTLHPLHKGNYAHTVIVSKEQNQQTALKWNAQHKGLHLM